MDNWKRFNETSLPDKEDFYCHLKIEKLQMLIKSTLKNMEKRKIKNLGEYHDFYVQSDTLLLPYVFESFRNKCNEICELDTTHFLSAPGLAW